MMRRRISWLLSVLMLISAFVGFRSPLLFTAEAADAFRYQHDPLENTSAMRDIVADENAVYGFRPSETGSLKSYAGADWSDPEIVAKGRADRIAYHESIHSMYDLLSELESQGKSVEEIARSVSARRNEIRLEAYADDPAGLETLKKRNLERYGHEEGPWPDELYAQYGSWETVLEKAFSTNAGMDACLGLYDDYYFLYAAMGYVPASVTIELPDSVFCRRNSSVALCPVIVSDTLKYSVSFESDDPAVAAVDAHGVITGRHYGTTSVRCVITDALGNRTVSGPCVVRIRPALLILFVQLLRMIRSFC